MTTVKPQETNTDVTEYTFTGVGYTLKLNGEGHAFLFDGSNEEIKDIAGRITALTALSAAMPLVAEALKNEANELQKGNDLIAKMSETSTALSSVSGENQEQFIIGPDVGPVRSGSGFHLLPP